MKLYKKLESELSPIEYKTHMPNRAKVKVFLLEVSLIQLLFTILKIINRRDV